MLKERGISRSSYRSYHRIWNRIKKKVGITSTEGGVAIDLEANCNWNGLQLIRSLEIYPFPSLSLNVAQRLPHIHKQYSNSVGNYSLHESRLYVIDGWNGLF